MPLDPQQLIDLAQKSGASHAEVYQSRSQSRPVFFEANRLKQLDELYGDRLTTIYSTHDAIEERGQLGCVDDFDVFRLDVFEGVDSEFF